MKTIVTCFTLFLFAGISLQAQDIQSIDIETSKDAYPSNLVFNSLADFAGLKPFAELNGYFYFGADDGIHGNELWRTDATGAGTSLVKDINPGSAASYVSDIITSGNHVYFIATDYVNGQQVWTSDGTAAGTHIVTVPGADYQSSRPVFLTDVDGTVYFVASLYGIGNQLWKTDGSTAGTVLVADFSAFTPFYGSTLKSLTNVNGKLFFTALTNNTDAQLYVSDGTAEGTHLVKDINPYGSDAPAELTALNGLLYFSATDDTGTHLWVSDGTDAGTRAVKNTNNISLNNDYDYINFPFTVKNDVLYFQGYTSTSDYELYRYNTTSSTASISLVKDIVPGPAGSYPSQLTNVNGTIFFTIFTTHAQLWKTDGTTAGTILVKDINPTGLSTYYALTNAGGTLAFGYGNDTLGYELWKSDGTSAGTVLVKDIFPGIYSSFPVYLTYGKGKFVFTATGASKGVEVWKSDGTAAGTVVVKDINHSSSSSSYPQNFTYTGNNQTFLTAGTNKYGYELYVTNGTDRGTKLAADLTPGSIGSYESLLTAFQGKVYFTVYQNGYYLSKSDGTPGSTSLFYSLDSIYTYGYIQQMVATDNLLYFTVFNYYSYQQELWRSDGTAAGTYAIKTDLSYFYSLNPVAVGTTLFFRNYEDATGLELWKTDGTATGTKLVKDIYAGSGSSSPSSLYNFEGKLYFSADYGYGPFLYTSDGTSQGTKLVKAILVAYATPFAQAGGKLFLDAYNTVGQGYELYATDGTTAGTLLVKDINKGPANSSPYSLVDGKNLLYFQADDGRDGTELWVSGGAKENTHLVKDITAGLNGTYISQRANVNDKLFFTINDSLWQSDATEAGTYPVDDATLDGANTITSLITAGDRLYFSAYKYSIGQELFTANVPSSASADMIVSNVSPSLLIENTFKATLLVNPVSDHLQLLISTQKQQQVNIIMTDAGGKRIATDQKMLTAGDHQFSYAAGKWLPGIYFIKVVAADGSSVLMKAVK